MKKNNFTIIEFMKQLVFTCTLLISLYSCSYGQGRRNAISKVEYALSAIKGLYVDTINSDKLAEDAIVGLLEKLDPHSTYLSAKDVQEANEPLQGNFDGIGVQFNMMTDTLYIIQVVAGGPSEKIGIMAGDKIIKVNDTLIAGVKKASTEVVSMLKGPKGTSVNVKILRRNYPELLSFNIVRDKIPIHSLKSAYMIDNETGYILLSQFATTSHAEFKEALVKLQAQGMKNLILDLQQNGGGILESAIRIANEFLKRDDLIMYMEGAHQRREEAKATYNGSFGDGRLIILVDEYSASASEIVSGAVQDWDRGIIVGRKTFGKGLVQRPVPLPDGSVIRLTTARYYTPSGRSIQKPYEGVDVKSYNKELIDRYNRGEMLSADSIHFPDSLKYSTLVEKRIVYGGGGIMPDYFVPINNDSTSWQYKASHTTLYYDELWGKGTVLKYARSLVDENRNSYRKQYPDIATFEKNFTVSDKMIADLMEAYKKEKAEELKEKTYKLTEEQLKDLEISKPLLQFQIKTSVVRDIFDENDYYRFSNNSDIYNDALKKAIEIVKDPEKYNKLLRKGLQ
jgi:carboxyl-terminal processing protease